MNDKKPIYKESEDDSPIRYGVRGNEFKAFISKMVSRGKLTEKYIKVLTNKNAIDIYEIAFTNPTADPINNYEKLEILGDATCNTCLVWYFWRKFFPSIVGKEDVKNIARMKIVYASKQVFSPIAEKAGFLKFASARENKFKHDKKSVGEDTFEAFFGATAHLLDTYVRMGTGYQICYNIMESFLDELVLETKYDRLVDNVTKLKELGDKHYLLDGSKIMKIQYANPEYVPTGGEFGIMKTSVSAILENGRTVELGRGEGATNEAAKRAAATKALIKLRDRGIMYYTDFVQPDIKFKY